MTVLPRKVSDSVTSSEAAYLDAARECIVAVGWRRTTLTEIARRAGVSRVTIYRRWPDVRTLLGDLLTREWSEIMAESGILGDSAEATREQIARNVAAVVAALRKNDLLVRIIEVDPEILLPYLFERLGRSQTWTLELIEQYVRTGQANGAVREGDPRALAHALLLTTYGFVLSARTLDLPTEELDTELLLLIERYLAP